MVEVCCSGAGVLQWCRCAAVVEVGCGTNIWRGGVLQNSVHRCVLQYIEHRVEAYCGTGRVEVCTAAHFERVEV